MREVTNRVEYPDDTLTERDLNRLEHACKLLWHSGREIEALNALVEESEILNEYNDGDDVYKGLFLSNIAFLYTLDTPLKDLTISKEFYKKAGMLNPMFYVYYVMFDFTHMGGEIPARDTLKKLTT